MGLKLRAGSSRLQSFSLATLAKNVTRRFVDHPRSTCSSNWLALEDEARTCNYGMLGMLGMLGVQYDGIEREHWCLSRYKTGWYVRTCILLGLSSLSRAPSTYPSSVNCSTPSLAIIHSLIVDPQSPSTSFKDDTKM